MNPVKESNYRPYGVSEWVVLLMLRANFEYINSLSLRDTHRFKREENETPRTYRGIKGKILQLGTPRLIDSSNTGRRMISNSRLSMESNGSTVENLGNF
jgi:hypothetical protein